MDIKAHRGSSPLHKLVQCLHITYICREAAAQYATHHSLHSCGIRVVLGVSLIQILLFGTFWDFPSSIFNPQLIKCTDMKAMDVKPMEAGGELYYEFVIESKPTALL